MAGWLRKFWDGVVDVGRDSLAGGVLKMNEEQYREEFNKTFESAKRLSDFIGMIVRIAFVAFAAFFFMRKVNETDELLYSTAYSVSLTFSLGLMFVMMLKVLRIILLYEGRAIPLTRGWGRGVLLVLAYFTTVSLILGVLALVSELASDALVADAQPAAAVASTN